MKRLIFLSACMIAVLFFNPALDVVLHAGVGRLDVESQISILDGKAFGVTGPYQKISGKIVFVFDPANPRNALIVDLDKAPRNKDGLVEASANFMVLCPMDPTKGSGTALLEVSNRGGKASLSYFNGARSSRDPHKEKDFGDAFLMRQGLTVIWVGWQYDVPGEPNQLILEIPVVAGEGEAVEGLVRSDWTLDRAITTLGLGHRNHQAYPVLDPAHEDNVLTVRDGRLATRRVVPRSEWRFGREAGGGVVDDREHIYMASEFEAGKIYELVYRAKDPAVVGLGLAAIRDMMAFAKYDERCPFPVKKGMALGISQTGRFLRHFLYQGFNTDEENRQVFDGMLIHTAGAGRGSFNHRFAQPSRDAHQYSAFFYPTDIFPFSGRAQRDPVTGRWEGILDRVRKDGHVPKIFYTNTGYEYWGRAASLLHTSLDGSADAVPLPEERIYHLASAQHFVRGFNPNERFKFEGARAYKDNPLEFLVFERALLVALQDWVMKGKEPPESAYPSIDKGTLVPVSQLNFPEIPGVPFPKVNHEAYRADYGERWNAGIIDKQPPELGQAFPTLVSQVDACGNEVAGVRAVEILVPLATYTPWHLRQDVAGGAGGLTDFYGTFIPLPRTEAEREKLKDPRPSVESLYESKEAFLAKVEKAADDLVKKGYLLEEDALSAVKRAQQHWNWVMKD